MVSPGLYYVTARGNQGCTNTSTTHRGHINNIVHSNNDSDNQNFETQYFYEQDLGSGYEYGIQNNDNTYQNFEIAETANTLAQNSNIIDNTTHSANNIEENDFDLNQLFFDNK